MAGVATTLGNVLNGGSVREVENHCSRKRLRGCEDKPFSSTCTDCQLRKQCILWLVAFLKCMLKPNPGSVVERGGAF